MTLAGALLLTLAASACGDSDSRKPQRPGARAEAAEIIASADAYREARVVSADLLADYTAAYYDLLRAAGGARTLPPSTSTPP